MKRKDSVPEEITGFGMLSRQIVHNNSQSSFRLWRRDVRFETTDDAECEPAALRGERLSAFRDRRQTHPQINWVVPNRKLEFGGHHTGDVVTLAIDRDGLPGHIRIGIEAVLPEAMTQDHGAGACLIFFRRETAAELRRYAEQGKQFRRHYQAAQIHRIALTSQRAIAAAPCGHPLEDDR